MPSLSALVTAYHRTGADELDLALGSLLAQTLPPDEIVLVFDGAVSDEVRQVAAARGVRVVTLERNVGSGLASQAGLDTITSTYVARLDSDDVAKPERFAAQVAYLEAHPETGAVGTAVEEFADAPGDGGAIRRLPEDPHDYLRINSPINNPSVMLRTAAVKEVGGYTDVRLMEDYDLYARLAAGGWRLHNLPEPLTYFRVNPAQFARRTGKGMFAAEKDMQARLVSYGLIGPWRARFNLAARTAYRMLPTALLTRVYAQLFHRS